MAELREPYQILISFAHFSECMNVSVDISIFNKFINGKTQNEHINVISWDKISI